MLLLAEPSFFPLSFSSLGCDIFESCVCYLCIFSISASALRSNEQTPDGCFSPSSLGPAFPIQHQNFLSGTRSVPSSLSAAPVSCQGEIRGRFFMLIQISYHYCKIQGTHQGQDVIIQFLVRRPSVLVRQPWVTSCVGGAGSRAARWPPTTA